MEKKSIALKYNEQMAVPVITAKGRGVIAEKIIEEARLNNIYIKEDETLVDVLDAGNLDEEIPENAWAAVAAIFSFIMEDL